MSMQMQLPEVVERLQQLLHEHGNIDVRVQDENKDPMEIFHIDYDALNEFVLIEVQEVE
jgi:hypothetical protein